MHERTTGTESPVEMHERTTGTESPEADVTRFQDQLLTPAYASPEQITGSPISTSTDLYTLGVVLYELLVGAKPFDHIDTSSYLEYERILLTRDPKAPSMALQSIIDGAAKNSKALQNIQRTSARRQTSPTRLQSDLQGDLDAIVLRTLRLDSKARYGSVELLIADLNHFLKFVPVIARKGNWLYVANRFIRRHFISCAAFGASALVVIAVTIGLYLQSKHLAFERDHLNHQRKAADNIVNFMTNVFDVPTETAGLADNTTARTLLKRAGDAIDSDLPERSLIKAQLLEIIGRNRRRAGVDESGLRQIEEALAIRMELDAGNIPAIAGMLRIIGKTKMYEEDAYGAKQSYRRGKEMLEQSHREDSALYGDILHELGSVENELGNPEKAHQYFSDALPLLKKYYGPQDREVALALSHDALTMAWHADYEQGIELLRDAVEIFRHSTPKLDPDRLLVEGMLGDFLFMAGHLQEATPLIEGTADGYRKLFGEDSLRVTNQLDDVVQLRRAQHRFEAAEELASKSLRIKIRALGSPNRGVPFARVTLAIVQWQRGKFPQAESELRKAIGEYQQTLSSDSGFICSAEHYLSETLLSQHREVEAADQARTAIQHLHKSNAPSWRVARSESVLGAALLAQRKFNEAQPLLEHSYEVLSTSIGPDRDTVQLAHDRLKRFYVARHAEEKLSILHAADEKRLSVDVKSVR